MECRRVELPRICECILLRLLTVHPSVSAARATSIARRASTRTDNDSGPDLRWLHHRSRCRRYRLVRRGLYQYGSDGFRWRRSWEQRIPSHSHFSRPKQCGIHFQSSSQRPIRNGDGDQRPLHYINRDCRGNIVCILLAVFKIKSDLMARRTSPTAYNVFTGYTYTGQQLANGVCSTTSTTVTLSSAYTETLATASGRVYLDQGGQRGFIEALGFSTCTGGGENYVNTALVQVSDLTVSTTNTYSSIPLAAMSTTFAPSPTSRAPVRTTTLTDVLTTLTATLEGSSTITPAPVQSAEVPEIVIGNSTITPNSNPLGLPFFTATIAATGTGAGTGAGTGSNGTVPFQGNAPVWGSGAGIWGSALLTFVMAVGWVL